MFNIKRNFIYCKGKLISFKKTKIMGILNLTPDSFYDGGKFNNMNKILKHVDSMINEGATFIDIGGFSTRPGFNYISTKEELLRITKTLNIIIKYFPNIYISIDTFRSKVALECLNNGADIINDVSGGSLDMFQILKKYKVPYILTYSCNYFKNNNVNIISLINSFFKKKLKKLKKLKIKNVLLDPGFGFNKKIEDNFKIIKNLNLIGFNKYPKVLGISRKKSLNKILNIKKNNSLLNSTTIMHVFSIINKVSVLRVHDVKEAIECVKLVNYYDKI